VRRRRAARDLELTTWAATQRDRPLALYVLTNDKPSEERILSHTISGGVTVNSCARC
jgi:hypothetical protein